MGPKQAWQFIEPGIKLQYIQWVHKAAGKWCTDIGKIRATVLEFDAKGNRACIGFSEQEGAQQQELVAAVATSAELPVEALITAPRLAL